MKIEITKLKKQIADSDVEQAVKDIIKSNKKALTTPENMKKLFGFIDLTTLEGTDTEDKVKKMCEKINGFHTLPKHVGIPNVAAVCVYPALVEIASKTLNARNLQVAAVSGGFPASQTFIEIKIAETKATVAKGANEIDMVISIGKFLEGNYQVVFDEIVAMKRACQNAHLKVILETGALKTAENIWLASMLAMYAGADFIKTSTGKTAPAATLEAAYVMTMAIKTYHKETGRKVGFKPAGGIATVDDAVEYLAIMKNNLSKAWLSSALFRIGASRLANNLLSGILGNEVKYF